LRTPPPRYDGKTDGCTLCEARDEKEGWTMPEVYTGKALIPGDQIDDYVAALKEAEETRVALKKFFMFLDQEQGIHNPTALEALR